MPPRSRDTSSLTSIQFNLLFQIMPRRNGGSWWYRVPDFFRCAYRIGPHPNDYTCLNGFRVAATIREGE